MNLGTGALLGTGFCELVHENRLLGDVIRFGW
jgi:hypothetical protein